MSPLTIETILEAIWKVFEWVRKGKLEKGVSKYELIKRYWNLSESFGVFLVVEDPVSSARK